MIQNIDLYNGLMNLVNNSDDDSFYFTDDVLDDKCYRIFNYRLVNYTTFTTNKFALYVRGIMFEVSEDGNFKNLVCLPMNKFFNYAEGNVNHNDCEVIAIHEKLDGSLISTYIHNGILMLKSKGSIKSQQCIDAIKFLSLPENKQLYDYLYVKTMNGNSVNCEWTSPNNRIVVGYDEDKLRILNSRNLITHELELYYYMGDNVTLHCDDKYSLLDSMELNDIVNDMYKEEVGEGYVITLRNDNDKIYQVKVKNFKYCDLHKLKDSINSNKALFSLVVNGQTDDLVEAFTNDHIALKIISDMENKVIPKFNSTIKFVDKFYDDNKHLDRKEYAILAKNTCGSYMPLVMNKYIDRKNDYVNFAIKNMDYYLGT